LSDDDIWKLVDEVFDFDAAQFASFGKREFLGLLIAKVDEIYEKLEDTEYLHHPADWMRDGWMITSMFALAGISDPSRKTLQAHCESISKKPRIRYSLINEVVKHVIGQSSGGFPEFRERVGQEREIDLDDRTVLLTSVEDGSGTVIGYCIDDLSQTRPSAEDPKMTSVGTISSAITRLQS